MRRWVAVILVTSFLGLGSGTVRFAHDFTHDCHHAVADAAPGAADPPAEPQDHDHPHESSCELHAVLNAPLVLAQAPSPQVELRRCVESQPLRPTPVQRLRLPTRIDCRGPPVSPA